MERDREGWGALLARVAGASAELLGAEARGLHGELSRSAKRVGRLAALAGLAFGVAFWGIGVLLTAAVTAAAIWLPLWGAALSVAAVLFVIAGILAAVLRSRWRQLDGPIATVGQRFDDHLAWWQSEVMGDARSEPGVRVAEDEPRELL